MMPLSMKLKFDTDTTEWCFAYSRLISVPVLLSAVDKVGQGHLLVAGELLPFIRRCEEVEVERRGQEVSDELTS